MQVCLLRVVGLVRKMFSLENSPRSPNARTRPPGAAFQCDIHRVRSRSIGFGGRLAAGPRSTSRSPEVVRVKTILRNSSSAFFGFGFAASAPAAAGTVGGVGSLTGVVPGVV